MAIMGILVLDTNGIERIGKENIGTKRGHRESDGLSLMSPEKSGGF